MATTEPDESPSTTTLAPGETPTTTLQFDETILRLEPVAEGFEQPVFYTTTGGNGFIVDQPGVIWIVTDGADPAVFLDLRSA